MPLAINDGRLGRLFYRDKKDGLPIVFQRLSFTNRKESSFFLGYGFQNKIARELVRLYTGLSMLFIPAAIIAIAVIMRLILKYLISDPLLAVQDAIGRFRSDENARVANPGRDEIGKLGMAFNMMAEARVFRRKALIDADRRRRDLIEAILKGFSNPLGRLEQCSMELKRLTSVDCTPAAPSSQTDSLVMEIERLVRLQSDLVDDLFTLSKLENVAAIPLEDPVAVDELLDELASRVGHRELQVSREGEAVYFEADAERLARAMSEYVSALADDPRGTGPVNAAIRNASNTVTVELLRHSGSESIDQKSATSSSHAADGFSIRRAIADRILVLHGGKVTSGIELQGSSILQRVTIELPRSR